jgi:hypothetical protein
MYILLSIVLTIIIGLSSYFGVALLFGTLISLINWDISYLINSLVFWREPDYYENSVLIVRSISWIISFVLMMIMIYACVSAGHECLSIIRK